MILYDFILIFFTLIVSIKKPHHFRRLFAPIPNPEGKEVIWIHAVSVGEARSIQTLFELLREEYRSAFFLVTTTTETGQAEVRRSLPTADAYAFLPIDLSWTARRWANQLQPKLFLLVESDLWPNLLSAIKKNGGKTILVSGKLSETSARRFALLRFFSKKFFSRLDLLCVQNDEHAQRFFPLAETSRIQIGGNLKLDQRPLTIDSHFWRQKLSLSMPALTLSCTHAPEEEKLLDLIPLDRFFLFLAPRHPERFAEVAQILQKKQIPYCRWTRLEERRGGERVLLMDVMGHLPICYALSRLAIVGGSFQPHVGGHNILEPCLYEVPVLFGPHMQAQRELVERILSVNAGKQVTYNDISNVIRTFFSSPTQEASMRSAAKDLIASGRGASAVTYRILQSFLKPGLSVLR